jgi:hypothetical protein
MPAGTQRRCLNAWHAGGVAAPLGCSAAPPVLDHDVARAGTAAGRQRGCPLELLPPSTLHLLMCYSKP